MPDGVDPSIVQGGAEMVRAWGWFLAFGIVLALLGVAIVVRSFAATSASMRFFGWLFLCAGALELSGALMVGRRTGSFQHLLAAILLLVTGCVVLRRPAIGVEVATLVMSMFFLIGGLYQIAASYVAGLPSSGWEVFAGVVASLMGTVLLLEWPLSGLWAIGLFVGTDLIISGCSWAALALGLRKT